ncbi:hypothetical protein PsAD37_03568 [Pseudovibrio sp. Ad37]|nr:hypothetical protein PsAD37_03568 [Pseudovibrio sp. Ad37]
MTGQVVKNDDVASLHGGRKLRFDILLKDLPVHGTVDHPWSVQPVMTQASNKSLGIPVAKRHIPIKPLSLWSPSSLLDHVCFECGLIDKDKSFHSLAHHWLAVVDPDMTVNLHI